jgi:hypothetical protein
MGSLIYELTSFLNFVATIGTLIIFSLSETTPSMGTGIVCCLHYDACLFDTFAAVSYLYLLRKVLLTSIGGRPMFL